MNQATAIDLLMQKQPHFNGVVLVAHKGQVTYQKAFGYANFINQKKMNLQSCFNLASVSKQFTAMGIMMLAEQGQLSYEDDITRFLPDLPYQGIQIKHLLWHTSGLPDYVELASEIWDQEQLMTNNDLLKLLESEQPERLNPPGTVYEYSNTGYSLLASIIEKASGQSFAAFMQNHIFKPLQMTNTFVYSPTTATQHETCRVYGYDPKSNQSDDLTYLDGILGDGGIYATAQDLLKWDQALYTDQLVKSATLKQAFQPGKLDNGQATEYGFGWLVDADGEWVAHTGSWVGFRTSISRRLKTKDTVIILTNTNNESIYDLEAAILEIIGN